MAGTSQWGISRREVFHLQDGGAGQMIVEKVRVKQKTLTESQLADATRSCMGLLSAVRMGSLHHCAAWLALTLRDWGGKVTLEYPDEVGQICQPGCDVTFSFVPFL